MPATREDLLARLAQLGITVATRDHPAVHTVAESERLHREIAGAHTKNLFLRDKDGALFLVVAEAHTHIDLKLLARQLGCGRLSFGRGELLQGVLGVGPGSVTAFAVMNDESGLVRVVIDERLMAHAVINCHPLVNTATTSIARDDLLRFIRASRHEPRILRLDGENRR